MNILLAASEVVPFAKTGGLADVAGALPIELARLGHTPSVFMPAYKQALASGQPIEQTSIEFSIPIGSKTVKGGLLRSRFPGSQVPVYLIEQPQYFDRDGLYGAGGHDYIDNCERFVFFNRAVIEAIRLLDLPVDVLHANDWQTGLLPALLKIEQRGVPRYERIASLFTIHNLAFQGQFWHWDMLLTGLDWKYFNWHQMEFFGKLNLLKTGLVFSDALSTVSPRYAEEIQASPLGCGLEGVLQQRRNVLTGILNGVDYALWNPITDNFLPVNYDVSTVVSGKAACKAALQAELGLEVAPRKPLIGIVTRLTEQKGVDLITSVMQEWSQASDAQWAIIGTGDTKYEQLMAGLAERFPQKIAVKLQFSEALDHKIEGGADIFLMPSHFEPCGLSQMYSLKYGAVPVVRATGGLADTIVDATPEALSASAANGFGFREYSVHALTDALRRATTMYSQQPDQWTRLMVTGMQQDWSWKRSAEQYVNLYRRIAAQAPQPACA